MECGKLVKRSRQYNVDVDLGKMLSAKIVDFDSRNINALKIMFKSNLFVLKADEVSVEKDEYTLYVGNNKPERLIVNKPKLKNPRLVAMTHNQVTQQFLNTIVQVLWGYVNSTSYASESCSPSVQLTLKTTSGATYTFQTNMVFAQHPPGSNTVSWIFVFFDNSTNSYTTQSATLSSNAFTDQVDNCSVCGGGGNTWGVMANAIEIATATVSITKNANESLVFTWVINIQLPSGTNDNGLFTNYIFRWQWIAQGCTQFMPPGGGNITVNQGGTNVNYNNGNFIFLQQNGQPLFVIYGIDTNLNSSYTVQGGAIVISGVNSTFPVSISMTKNQGTAMVYIFGIGVQAIS